MSDLGATPLETLTAEFIATLGDPRRQASTARAYRDDLRQLCAIVADEGVWDLAALTRPVLGRWVRTLTARGYASEVPGCSTLDRLPAPPTRTRLKRRAASEELLLEHVTRCVVVTGPSCYCVIDLRVKTANVLVNLF
jgi:hypothetical protein